MMLSVVLPLGFQPAAARSQSLESEVLQLMRAGSPDEAEALIRRKEKEKTAPRAEIARLLLKVFQHQEPARRMRVLQEVKEKYSDVPIMSMVYFDMANVHAAGGDIAKTWQAVSDGLQAEVREARAFVRAGDKTHDLRNWHINDLYLLAGEWEKAQKSHSELPAPKGFCGTCDASTVMRRRCRIAYSFIHMNRHEDAAEQIFPALRDSHMGIDHLPRYMLIRLYSEAKQLADLRKMVTEFADRTRSGPLPEWVKEKDKDRTRASFKKEADAEEAVLQAAIDLAQRSTNAELVRILGNERPSPEDQLRYYIAWWRTLEDPGAVVPLLKKAVWREAEGRAEKVRFRGGDLYNHRLVKALAGIDTREARQVLLELGDGAPLRDRQSICNVLLERLRQPESELYFVSWPQPAAGSLPKKLPTEIVR